MLDPFFSLSPQKYREEALIGAAPNQLQSGLTVFDTGARWSPIWSGLLRKEALDSLDRDPPDQSFECLEAPLSKVDVLSSIVRIKGYTAFKPFIANREVGTDEILGTNFIEGHVDTISIRRNVCIF